MKKLTIDPRFWLTAAFCAALLAAPPLDGPQPGQQFFGVVGFDQVVIGPRVQPPNAVADLVAGGDGNHSGAVGRSAQLRQQREAVAIGQV